MNKYKEYQAAIEQAKKELRTAERMLELVEPEFTVWAAMEVQAKMEKLNVLFKLAKEECA